MAFRNDKAATESTSTRGAAKPTKAILGYVNIGINTSKPGDVRRVDSIRLMEGNLLHEAIFAGLNGEREDDPKFEVPEGASDKVIADLESKRKALLAERLAGFISKLNVSFNPSRTDADSDLIQF